MLLLMLLLNAVRHWIHLLFFSSNPAADKGVFRYRWYHQHSTAQFISETPERNFQIKKKKKEMNIKSTQTKVNWTNKGQGQGGWRGGGDKLHIYIYIKKRKEKEKQNKRRTPWRGSMDRRERLKFVSPFPYSCPYTVIIGRRLLGIRCGGGRGCCCRCCCCCCWWGSLISSTAKVEKNQIQRADGRWGGGEIDARDEPFNARPCLHHQLATVRPWGWFFFLLLLLLFFFFFLI